jgi:hypothetical protein
MPNNKTVPIKTIQFLDISFKNREAFLDFIKTNVIEFALNKQELFKAMGCNAEHFHKDKQNNTITKTLIHSLVKDNVFTLRAYTQKAIDTLDFWFTLYKKEHKHYVNTIISTEQFEYKQLSKPQHYTSYNWAPFRDVVYKNNTYYIEKNKPITNKDFKNQLFNNLLYGFIQDVLMLDDKTIKVNPTNFDISKNYQSILALKKDIAIKRHVFKTTFSINVQLPSYFSLGQNVGYGLGVFHRDYSKPNIKSYEKPKTKPKPNKTE